MMKCPAAWLERLGYLGVVHDCDWGVRRMFALQDTKGAPELVSEQIKMEDNWYYTERANSLTRPKPM